jgi:hypothetical protein
MVISTKLPIVKNLIEIIILIQTYQNDMKMVLDRCNSSAEEKSRVQWRYKITKLTKVSKLTKSLV